MDAAARENAEMREGLERVEEHCAGVKHRTGGKDGEGDSGLTVASNGKVPTRNLKIPDGVEQLLAEFIEGYPIIWNPEPPEHNNSTKKDQVWAHAGRISTSQVTTLIKYS